MGNEEDVERRKQLSNAALYKMKKHLDRKGQNKPQHQNKTI